MKANAEISYETFIKAARYDIIVEVMLNSIKGARWNGEKTHTYFDSCSTDLETIITAFENERTKEAKQKAIEKYDKDHPYETIENN